MIITIDTGLLCVLLKIYRFYIPIDFETCGLTVYALEKKEDSWEGISYRTASQQNITKKN